MATESSPSRGRPGRSPPTDAGRVAAARARLPAAVPILTREPTLSFERHDRDVTSMTYVYPVVSRRAGGVSVGVNLNPNRKCNWQCIYCQVPGLSKGLPPAVDLGQLREELRALLDDIVHGEFLARAVPPHARRLHDVALSGNGEPTLSPQFSEVVDLVGEVLSEFDLLGRVRVVLITNGSRVQSAQVRPALRRLSELGGEIWFKLDLATRDGIASVNRANVSAETHLARLRDAAGLCPTYVQTCMFRRRGEPPSDDELTAYLHALRTLHVDGSRLLGVLLYSLARPSQQPEATELAPVEPAWLERLATRIRSIGLDVRVSP